MASRAYPIEPLSRRERRRLRLVHALLLVIASGSLFDLVTGREQWQFSAIQAERERRGQ
jgi:hypothetical protein